MRSRDDLCLIVNEVRKKNTITHYSCSGVLLFTCHIFSSFSQKLLSNNLSPLEYPVKSSIRCSIREDQVTGTLTRCKSQRLGLLSSLAVAKVFRQ